MVITAEKFDATRIEIMSDFAERDKDRIKMLAGAHYPPREHRWFAPLTWATCRALRGVFGQELVVGPELNAWALAQRSEWIDPAKALRTAWDAAGDSDLYPFQRAGVQMLTFVKRALLCDEMGTGKTIQVIRTLANLVRAGHNPFPGIVVAPNNMVFTWRREIEKWFPGVSVGVVKGSLKQRRAVLEQSHHLYIVNWEGVRSHSRLQHYPGGPRLKRCVVCDPSLADIPTNQQSRCEWCKKELNLRPWTTVIADEAHRMKNPKSKQTQAVWSLRTPDTEFIYAMTGTAIADQPIDLWPALHLISRDEFPSRNHYVERYCNVSFDFFGTMEIVGLRGDTKDEFFDIIDPRMRRMPKEAVLPFLPKKTYSERVIEMLPKQAKAYSQMQDGMMALIDGAVVVAQNPLVQLGRLTQFASSYCEAADDGSVTMAMPSNKISTLLEIMEEMGGESVVVMAQSRQLIEMAAKALEDKGFSFSMIVGGQTAEERDKQMIDFQEGRTQACLCTIQAGGIGITLTRAGTLVFLQRSWSMIDNAQAEDRVHRIGSEIHDKIQIIDIISLGTVEEAQRQVLAGKSERLEEIMRDVLTLTRLRDEERKGL